MITSRQILSKIQEISRHYFSGRPPIDINGLTQELQVPKEEIIPVLKELEAKQLISFYTTTQDAIKLTPKGAHKDSLNGPS
jgi:DNA-binding MarR family transcriptional regulator